MFTQFTTGQVVDTLILIKDRLAETYEQVEAINLACNALEKFPNDTDIYEALGKIAEIRAFEE